MIFDENPFGVATKVRCDAGCRWRHEHCEVDTDCPATFWFESEYQKDQDRLAREEANLADQLDGNTPGMVRRSDGEVLFRAGTTYLVFAGGVFSGDETLPKVEALLKREGITVEKFTSAKAYGYLKKKVGAEVVYAIYAPDDNGAHRMQAEGFLGDLDIGGARGNVAADVILRGGKIVFDPPSDWDGLTDKEEKILYCLEQAGKWVSPPELAKLVQAEYAKQGTGGFSEKVVRSALSALVKLGEAEGPIRRKYKYLSE